MDIQTALKSKNVHIIDVRETYEFNTEHIEGARNMPLSKFNDYIEELKQLVGPIVFYCRSGNRSGQAAQYLKQLGLTDVHNGGSLALMSSYLIPHKSF